MVGRWRMILAILMTIVCPLAPAWAQQPLFPGKTGRELEGLVRDNYAPRTRLTYGQAKQAMFARVDKEGGEVRLLYAGGTIRTDGVPSDAFVNAEHVWPQSRFGSSAGGKKSDLHHLFPTYATVNSSRGNLPFGEIPDAQTEKWWNGPTFVRGVPGANIDTYSEATRQRFEPRETDKGDVARAMFYFRTIYGGSGIETAFFDAQRDVLLRWHQVDPADAREAARNDRVAREQGNRNPFVDDASLASRVFGSPGPTPLTDMAPTAVAAATVTGVRDGDEIDIMTWNLEFFYDADTSDNQSELALEKSAESEAAFAERVSKIAQVIHRSGLPEIVALQEIENRKVVQRLADELNSRHGAKYQVGFVQGTDTETEQDVAFLYADRGLNVTFARMPTAGFDNGNIFKMPSKHCVMSVSHATPDGEQRLLAVVNCHLKAGKKASDEAKRRNQSRVISRHVGQLLAANPNRGVIVLGDMNAGKKFSQTSAQDGMGVLRGMETNTPDDDLLDLNGELEPAERGTHVTGRELDRILLSGSLLDDRGLVFQQVTVRRDLVHGESDHVPMIATFVYREAAHP